MTKYKPSRKGGRELMNSPEMMKGIDKAVQEAKDNAYHMCGSGKEVIFIADTQTGKNRAHGMVKTGNYNAARLNADNNILLKALGGVSV